MVTLTAQYRLELTTIQAPNLLFHNYTHEDIHTLCQRRAFAHTWNEYLGGGSRTVALSEFWDMWPE